MDILPDIIYANFDYAHPDVLATWVPFVTASILANPEDVEALYSDSLDALQMVLADFQVPSGNFQPSKSFKAKGVVWLFWPPGPRRPPPPGVPPQKKQRVTKRRQEHPFKPFGEILDPGSESIDTMMKLLPDYSDMFWLDLYTRRQPIQDSITGDRLPGSKPFEHDPTVSLHVTHATMQVEAAIATGNCDFILLCGRAVEQEFVNHFGAYEHGKKKKIAGKEVRGRDSGDGVVTDSFQIFVWQIDHPEYIKNRSSIDRVKSQTLKTLRAMRNRHGIRIGEDWLLGHIEAKERKKREREQSEESETVEDEKIDGIDFKDDEPLTVSKEQRDSAATILTREREDLRRRPRSEAQKKHLSEALRRNWANLTPSERDTRNKATREGILQYWATLSEQERADVRAARSATMRRTWANRTPSERRECGKGTSEGLLRYWANLPEQEKADRKGAKSQQKKDWWASLDEEARLQAINNINENGNQKRSEEAKAQIAKKKSDSHFARPKEVCITKN